MLLNTVSKTLHGRSVGGSNRPETRCSSSSIIEFPNELLVNRLDNVGGFYNGPTEIVRLGERFKIVPTRDPL